MTVFCSQCGAEIEDGADFCYQCGALRSVAFDMDDSGNLRPVSENATRMCPNCGFSNPFDAAVCADCGKPMPSMSSNRVPKALDGHDWLVLGAGIGFALVGILGVGHLLLHRWSRGFMYICMSVIILYIMMSLGFYTVSNTMMLVRILSFFLFFKCTVELLELVYYPEDPGRKGGE